MLLHVKTEHPGLPPYPVRYLAMTPSTDMDSATVTLTQHKCNKCDKFYSSDDALQEHYRNYHPTCGACDIGFEDEDAYDAHVLATHRLNPIVGPASPPLPSPLSISEELSEGLHPSCNAVVPGSGPSYVSNNNASPAEARPSSSPPRLEASSFTHLARPHTTGDLPAMSPVSALSVFPELLSHPPEWIISCSTSSEFQSIDAGDDDSESTSDVDTACSKGTLNTPISPPAISTGTAKPTSHFGVDCGVNELFARCQVCAQEPRDPTLTTCGHLFCNSISSPEECTFGMEQSSQGIRGPGCSIFLTNRCAKLPTIISPANDDEPTKTFLEVEFHHVMMFSLTSTSALESRNLTSGGRAHSVLRQTRDVVPANGPSHQPDLPQSSIPLSVNMSMPSTHDACPSIHARTYTQHTHVLLYSSPSVPHCAILSEAKRDTMAEEKSETVIREVSNDVWTFSRPFNLFSRLPVGGRSTAIKLPHGQVWILASTPLDNETRKKLSELGEVKYIVAGNAFHHMFLKDYKAAYPSASVIGPEELGPKKEPEGFKLDKAIIRMKVFSSSKPDQVFGFEKEIDYCYFSGYKNKDVAYYHRASKTVIAADLIFNLPGTEQYAFAKLPAPYFPFASHLSPFAWFHKAFLWSKVTDKAAMQREVRKVASWDFEKFIPCHGVSVCLPADVIDAFKLQGIESYVT
ncbi:hypothetical protein NM688_g1124 [Phlebia brevispora]|uniref:Uncharacterized protein n=1 Tax=Phlebia brevispora TaxID=194682 RepID=A0ACC1TCF3_9APHY|nr:hypothetical protein NM688_g1124 [Phlebia brevispora]